MENNTLTLRFSIIEPLADAITLADLAGLLVGKVDAITGPSPAGGARQSHEPGNGGTLKVLRPNYGYEVVLKEGITTLTIPGVRVLNGTPATAAPTTTPANAYAKPGYMKAGYAKGTDDVAVTSNSYAQPGYMQDSYAQ